jgi:hypothetical protein
MVLVITNTDVLISRLMDVFGLDWAVQGDVSGCYAYVVKAISDQLGLHSFCVMLHVVMHTRNVNLEMQGTYDY